MIWRTILMFTMAFWLLIAWAAGAFAAPAYGIPPVGYTKFCAKNIEFCKAWGEYAPVTRLTLEQLNIHVNRTVRQVNEPEGQDVWRLADAEGDCEDIALRKIDMLMKAGYARSQLRLAHVTTEEGENHIILVVLGASEPLYLDNRFNVVVTHQQLVAHGYVFHAVESPFEPMKWVRYE